MVGKKCFYRIGLVAILLAVFLPSMRAVGEEQTFYLGSRVNAGLDTGYSETNEIVDSDPHFGWQLGSFYVSGFTAVQRDDNQVTFLKTVGNKVTLNFKLEQDINSLNGNDSLSISDDKNGFDQPFGIEKSESGFGRGTLIIRQIDYQNASRAPQVYTNYLEGVAVGADTEVALFEEGDYEIVLDYEIKNDVRRTPGLGPIPSISIAPEYSNYTIRFKFSVRNGNTMVFLFDAENGSELTNEASAPNGFSIDLARSRYLDVNVKREVLSGDHFDVRFNGPAEDGTSYTDEGVYTIAAHNPSTGQTTEKIIYVGDDPQLKAYAITGYSLEEIRDMISQGAKVDDDGNLYWPEQEVKPSGAETGNGLASEANEGKSAIPTVAMIAITALVVLVAGVCAGARKRANRHEEVDHDEADF